MSAERFYLVRVLDDGYHEWTMRFLTTNMSFARVCATAGKNDAVHGSRKVLAVFREKPDGYRKLDLWRVRRGLERADHLLRETYMKWSATPFGSPERPRNYELVLRVDAVREDLLRLARRLEGGKQMFISSTDYGSS